MALESKNNHEKNVFFSRFWPFCPVKLFTRGFLNTYNLIRLKSRDSEKLVALESINNGKNSIFLEILTVIQVKTLYWGVFEAAKSNEKKIY